MAGMKEKWGTDSLVCVIKRNFQTYFMPGYFLNIVHGE